MYKMLQLEHNRGFTGTLWKSRKTRKNTLKLWFVGGKWLEWMELVDEAEKW
jgi:hypothetical protein